VTRLIEQGIKNIAVLEAMRVTPRHVFIDEALAHRAYEDVSLPIGHAQTISQPYIVARMTEVLMGIIGDTGRVLEIGTGCGYQTAVLSNLFKRVYSMERIAPLQQKAKSVLDSLKLTNIQYKLADGNYGWPQNAPYDGIIATAAAPEVPDYLLDQLGDNGAMVIPIGDEKRQHLMLYRKQDGELSKQRLEPVFFVPFLNGVVR
jgi:protein-L-isoaspartate(D-aspartate) O-methyltransferase